ncbi:hypothetical protein AB1Y20_018117 [Prymnesium parvum]|uniref:Uncharacterized protein n=1 Tax=Prymnesium parvum TaxID=97485 RepID=A0AB34JQX0_PRYPA
MRAAWCASCCVCALAALPSAAALVPPAPPLNLGRRAALRAALALPFPLLAFPAASRASCVCKTVSQCECTDDTPAAGARKLRRADAAGRDLEDGAREREQLMRELEAPARTARAAAPPRPPPPPRAPLPPRQYEQGSAARAIQPVRSMDSQEFSQIDPDSAKAKFARVVEEAVRKREEKLGFALDKDDIESLVGILRVKYCGPQGMIGPC